MAEVFASYRQAAQFSAERFNSITLMENERVRTILACFEPGQFIPVHAPGVDLELVILEGTGRIVAGDQEIAFQPGTMACVAAGEARGLKADIQTVAFFVVTPPPTAADHAGVAAGLRQGKWKM